MKKEEYTILVSVGELWLKGRNQKSFVMRLLDNMRAMLGRSEIEIVSLRHAQGSISLVCAGEKDMIISTLQKLPGISQFSFVESVERDIEEVDALVAQIFDAWIAAGVTQVRFDTRRRDKTFSLISPEINARLGAIASEKGVKCDYKNANHTVRVIVDEKEIFISHEKYDGIGGLPVGSSGKGLVLLSGGIDSPVAAVRMMTRGVKVDYVHFHTFPQNSDVLETKIPEIIRQVSQFAPRGAKLYCVPYTFFDLAAQGSVPERMHVIFFKNFMHQFAAKIADAKKYQMVINGDALAQVASQTPENMRAAIHNVDALLLRPLVGMCKEEIIGLSHTYGLYEESIKPYKDCCSLVAKNPMTRVNFHKFLAAYEEFPMQQIIEETYDKMEIFACGYTQR